MPDPPVDRPPDLAPTGSEIPTPSERTDPSREHVIVWCILAFVVGEGVRRLVTRFTLEASYTFTDFLEHLCFSATLAFFAIYLSRDAPQGWRRRLLLVKPNVSGAGLLLIILSNWGVLVLGVPLQMLADSLFGPFESSPGFFDNFENATPAWSVAFILAGTLGPGIAEELLFRGYLQQGLLKSLRPSIAILITALLFSAGHLPLPRALGLIPHAVWLGFIAFRTGSLVPSMLCHILTNLTMPLVITTGADPVIVTGILALIGAPSFVLALRALRRAPSTAPVPSSAS